MMKIGIDPDCSKSGIAIKKKVIEGGLEIEGQVMSFFDLYVFLCINRKEIKEVVIEGGWLNKKANFRIIKSVAAAERIAKNVGANHETGKKIVEMCEFLNIPHKVVPPLRKKWKGINKKITHDELVKMIKNQNINIVNKKTNQEIRDAILLIL
ncbi:hypothetical protein PG616_01205 [Riemerella anatipestifer]|nr:hypothetical protein [Riemerella anatipestifer]